jgi:hypothetical protein
MQHLLLVTLINENVQVLEQLILISLRAAFESGSPFELFETPFMPQYSRSQTPMP